MLDLEKLSYRLVSVTPEGQQLDLTDVATALGWSEGEKELSAKIQFKLSADAKLGDKFLTDLVKPNSPVFVYADMGNGFEEVCRGNVQKWELVETNKSFALQIETADEAHALRQSEDDFYFTDGHSSTAILEEILNKWGVPHEIHIKDDKHSKKVYRKKNLADMLADVLKDLKEKGGGVYFIRAKNGIIEIIPRGSNETIYCFDVKENLIRTQESFDIGQIVTRVQVVAKSKDEGHQKIESTVDGKTEFGVKQRIYTRGDKESLAEAETAAKKILDEQGDAKHKLSVESPDLPTLRKGDRIRITSTLGEGYYFVKSIRHNAATAKMTFEIDEDKDKNKSVGVDFDTSSTDESDSSAPS